MFYLYLYRLQEQQYPSSNTPGTIYMYNNINFIYNIIIIYYTILYYIYNTLTLLYTLHKVYFIKFHFMI